MMLLTDRYADKISGVLSCFDRVVIQGALPKFCYAQGMGGFLSYNQIRIFDYPRFAEPLRDTVNLFSFQGMGDGQALIVILR